MRKKFMSLTLCFTMLLSIVAPISFLAEPAAAKGGNLTLIASQDAYVQGASQTGVAKGAEDPNNLNARDWSDKAGAPGAYMLPYLQFELPSADEFADLDDIQAVTLKVFCMSGKNDRYVVGLSDLESFDEKTFTYTNALAGDKKANLSNRLNFDQEGLRIDGSETVISTANNEWLEFNVTEKIKELIAANTSGVRRSVVLTLAPRSREDFPELAYHGSVIFCSKEYQGGVYAPRLEVRADARTEKTQPALRDYYVNPDAGNVESGELRVSSAEQTYLSFSSDLDRQDQDVIGNAKVILQLLPGSAAPEGLQAELLRSPDDSSGTELTGITVREHSVEVDVTPAILECAELGVPLILCLRSGNGERVPVLFSSSRGERGMEPLLCYDVIYQGDIQSLSIVGAEQVEISLSKVTERTYGVEAYDQYGEPADLSGIDVTYSLDSGPSGVSVSPGGVLTVLPEAMPGTAVLRAARSDMPEICGTMEVAVTLVPPETAVVMGAAKAKIPEQGKTLRKPYFVELYNGEGIKMPPVLAVNWSVKGPAGIGIEPGEQGTAELVIENPNGRLKPGDMIEVRAEAALYPEVSSALTVVLGDEDEAYSQIVIPVAEDTYIKKADYAASGNVNNQELLAKQRAVTPFLPGVTDYFEQEGTNRETYLKFRGLAKIPKQIISAQLQLTTRTGFTESSSAPIADMPEAQVYRLEQAEWSEQEGTIRERLGTVPGLLASAVYATSADAKTKFDLTDAMREILTSGADEAAFRVSMAPVRSNSYTHNYYSKDAVFRNEETGLDEPIAADKKPQLVLSASYVREPAAIALAGESKVGIMLEAVQKEYAVYLVDQYGQQYTDEEMKAFDTSLALSEEYPGVVLNGRTLIVSPDAQAGTVKFRADVAEHPELGCALSIELYRAEAAVIRLDGPDTVQLPAEGDVVYAQYNMQVFDQQGNAVRVPDVVYELAEPQVGVSIDSTGGQLKVTNYAVANREISIVAYSQSRHSIRVEKPVKLLPVTVQTGREKHPNLLYANEDLVALRKKINTEPFAAYYSSLKQTADAWSTDDIVYLAQTDTREPADDPYDHVYPLVETDENGRERVLDRKRPWQHMMTDLFYTQGNFTFTPPENARYARLQAVAKGQGITNFDDFAFQIESGSSIELYNSSMETGNQRYVNEDLPYTDGNAYQVVETSKEGWEYLNDVESPMPDGWFYIRKAGSDAEFEWVNQSYHKDKVVNAGTRAAKIRNNSVSCAAGISTDKIGITPGRTYVLTTAFGANDKLVGEKGRIREYEPLDKTAGLSMQVVYYDAEGQELGTVNWEDTAQSGKPMNINWQAKPLRRSFDNAFDACCTIYAVTKNLDYAIRAKEILKYQLEDMKWGMRYRTTNGYNAKMNDSYEAVHTGRTLQRDALGYDMIYDSGVIHGEEDSYIRNLFNWVAYELTSTAYYNYAAANGQIHNYNADRISALTMYMLCFPDNKGTEENKYKDSFDFFYHHVLDENNVWSLPTLFKNGVYDAGEPYGGMWCENMRYHRSVLAGWLLAAKALDRFDPSMNWLQRDELKKMSRMWCTAQGPRLVVSTTAKNLAGYPTVGDSSWRESVDMAAWCASIYQRSDPELSKELMYTWDRMGSQLGGSYPINILMDNDPTLPRKNPQISSMSLDKVGYTYFWQNFDVLGKENFVLIPNSPGYGNKNQVIHDHHDRGSFAYIANGTPMSLDSGMGAYFGSDSAFWRSSKSHNEILFWSDQQGEWLSNAGGDGNSYTSDTGKTRYYDSETTGFFTSPELDRVTIRVNPAKRSGKDTNMQWNRHFAYVKDGINALIFWDEVKNTRRSQFNLFMASTGYTQKGDMVLADMQNNMQMEVHLLGSGNPEITDSWVPSAGKYDIPIIDGEEQQQLIQYEQENGTDYLTVLFAKNSGAGGLAQTKLQTGNDSVTAYRMTRADTGASFYIICNEADADQECTIGSTAVLRDPQTGETVPAKGPMRVKAGEMRIFVDDSLASPAAFRMELTGETAVGVPYGEESLTYGYDARVFDQYGSTLDNAQVRYEIVEPPENCMVDADGTLILSPGFESGRTIRLRAYCGEVSAELQITADVSDTAVAAVDIVGSNTLVIPERGSVSYTYQAVFKNASGAPVSGVKPLWSLLDATDGVAVNSYTGDVQVSSGVRPGTIIHINAAHSNDPSVNKTLEILLVKAAEAGIFVNAPEEFGITEGTEAVLQLTGYRTDQQGGLWQEGGIVYALKQAAEGVSIDENGRLMIGPAAKAGQSITVIASSVSDVNNRREYRIRLVPNAPASLSITGPDQITARSAEVSETYNAVVLDKNGAVTEAPVIWSILGRKDVSAENGTVRVAAKAGGGSVVLKAALADDTAVSASKKIQIIGYSDTGNSGGHTGGGGGAGGSGGGVSGGTSAGNQPVQQEAPRFEDVPDTHWAAAYIYELVKAGAVNGKTSSAFEPETEITRAEFVKILVRALNLQAPVQSSAFRDVTPADWWYESVQIAAALGIVNGYTEDYFGAGEQITREQMAAMICRTLSLLEVELPVGEEAFADQRDISDYALESVMALKSAGILEGKGDNRFLPQDYAARAEAAKVICVVRRMIKE